MRSLATASSSINPNAPGWNTPLTNLNCSSASSSPSASTRSSSIEANTMTNVLHDWKKLMTNDFGAPGTERITCTPIVTLSVAMP